MKKGRDPGFSSKRSGNAGSGPPFQTLRNEINVKKILAVQLTQLMQLRKESLKKSGLSGFEHLFHSAVQIYESHIFIISSSSFPGILRTNLMTSSQLA